MTKELLDRIWTEYRDAVGITKPEIRTDYARMVDPVYIPTAGANGRIADFTGSMPNGDPINQSSTFINLRSFLQADPKWAEIQAYIAAPGSAPPPTFTYHRFWANTEFAISNAALHHWFADVIY